MDDNNILTANRYISINKANGEQNLNRKVFSPDDRQIMENFPRTQSMLDKDSDRFKYGLEQSKDKPSLFFQDPLFLTFDLVIDQNSPLFSENINGAGGFITMYAQIKSISNRRDVYDEFKKRLGELFNIGTNSNNNINKSYYINSISGLDKLSARIVKYEDDKITINMNEDVSMISAYVAHLYNILSYSYRDQKEMIPANLLRFNMFIKIHDVRNMPFYLNSIDSNENEMTFEKSYQIYILRDCNFVFRDSKNFDDSIVRGGFDAGQINKASDLSIDIYYKSIEIESEYPLIRNSFNKGDVDSLKLNNKKSSIILPMDPRDGYPFFNNEFINNYKSVEQFYEEQNRSISRINPTYPAPKPTSNYEFEGIIKNKSLQTDTTIKKIKSYEDDLEKLNTRRTKQEDEYNRNKLHNFHPSVINNQWNFISDAEERRLQTFPAIEYWRNSLMSQLNFENYLRQLPLRIINLFLNGYHGMQTYYLQDYVNIQKLLSDERIETELRDKDELNYNEDRITYIIKTREYLDGEIIEYVEPNGKPFDYVYIPFTLPRTFPFNGGYIPIDLPLNKPFDTEYIPFRLKKREYLEGDRMISRIRPIIRLNNETIQYLIDPRLYLNGEIIPYEIDDRLYLNGEIISYEIDDRLYLNGEFIPYEVFPKIPLSGRIDTEIKPKLPLSATIDLTPRVIPPFESLYVDITARVKPEFDGYVIPYEIEPKLPLSGSIQYDIKAKQPLSATIDLTPRVVPPFVSEYLYQKVPFDRTVELGLLYVKVTKENILPLTYLYSKVEHFNSMTDYRLYNNAFSEIKNLNNLTIDLSTDYEKNMERTYIYENIIEPKTLSELFLYNNNLIKNNNLSLSYIYENEPISKNIEVVKIYDENELEISDLKQNTYLYEKVILNKVLNEYYLYPKNRDIKVIDEIVIDQGDMIYRKIKDMGNVSYENNSKKKLSDMGRLYEFINKNKYLLEPVRLYEKPINIENEINLGDLYEQTSKIKIMEQTYLYDKNKFNNNIEKITLDFNLRERDYLNGDKLDLDIKKKINELDGDNITKYEDIQFNRDKEKRDLNNERLG